MLKIWAMAVKDLRLLMTDKVGLFFVWCWPVIFVVFFGYVFSALSGGDGGEGLRAIPVAVVNEDQSEASRELIAMLSAEKGLQVEPADSRPAGEDLVRRGRRAACIVVPAGFQAARDNIFTGQALVLDVVVDPARPMEAGMTRGLLQAAMFRQFQSLLSSNRLRQGYEEVMRSPEFSESQRRVLSTFLVAAERFAGEFDPQDAAGATQPSHPSTNPDRPGELRANGRLASRASGGHFADWGPFQLRVQEITQVSRGSAGGAPAEDRPHTAFSIVVPQGIAWGVMTCAATFAVWMVVERTRGTLPRLLIAPVHRWQVLAGKGLACFISTVGVMIGMIVLARFVFGVRPESTGLLLLAVLCIGIAIVGVMMLFAVSGKTEAAVGGISWAVLVIMAMLGGGMIPLSQLSGWLRPLSTISVFRWAIQALDGAIWRGYSFTDMLQPCGVLLAIGVGGFAVGASIFRWQSVER